MIEYKKYTLDNGLRLLIHKDESTPLVAVNTLYQVGSKHESPERTGFAHLFEHLMFSGSANAPNFDTTLQMAGGDNNAFTNSDYTNFYEHLPVENVEVALWLEADRMANLNINQHKLDVQRRVVLEEFAETCLNKPYGDVWHHLSELAYKQHSYRWPVIGKQLSHIEEATLEDVKQFYERHYTPANAVVTVAGNVDPDLTYELTKKWFAGIDKSSNHNSSIVAEKPQDAYRFKEVHGEAAVDAIYMAFHSSGRLDADYHTSDIITDALANGSSSRLYRRLKKKRKVFSAIDSYISGTTDSGLVIIEGKLADGISLETAQKAIWNELNQLCEEGIEKQELDKLKNQIEVSLVFADIHILNKAITLSLFESLNQTEMVNQEAAMYRAITADDFVRVSKQIFRPENCCELWYRASL